MKDNIKIDISDKYFCYILGLLWGDGYLYKGRVGISMISEDLEPLINIFNYIGSWKISRSSRKDYKEQITLRVSDKKLYSFLTSMDFDIKSKTSPNKILSVITEYNVKYFLRGLFDADGCFYLNRNTRQCIITSNYSQNWDFLSSFYSSKGWKHSIGKQASKTGNRSFIRITNKDILKFGNFIYNGDSFGIERKYNKFMDIENSYIKKTRVGNNKKSIYIDDVQYNSISEAVLLTGINREVIRYRLKSKKFNYRYNEEI
jgi:hypothetical protein